MHGELDPQTADTLAFSAICALNPPRGSTILCTRRALHEAICVVAREAYEIGFLAGQQHQHAELNRPGSPDRPPWMDIRLDDPKDLAKHQIRIKPVVLKSLIGAGYHCLGDLRWVSIPQLRALYYVGTRTARQIRAIVQRFERSTTTDRPAPVPAAEPAGSDN